MTTMVEALSKHGIIRHPRVAAALLAVDRGDFVLDPSTAYYDTPQPIGHGATISAPHMHAHVLEHMHDKLVPGAVALDVGSGSGFLAAAMCELVSPGGRVFGIEHIPALVEWSKRNVAKHHPQLLATGGPLTLLEGDGYAGLPAEGPFDAIHVGAAAPSTPVALLDQLKVGGRLIIPVGRFVQELMQ